MAKTLTEMAVEITAAQSSHVKMSPEDVVQFLEACYERLKKMKAEEEGGKVVAEPVVDPMKSVKRNKVICLECGQEFKKLTNAHLKTHGLTQKEYKKKWGLPSRMRLTAKNLVERHRALAKEKGLGERLKKARQAKKAQKVAEGASQ